jgi:hypothetical protein
MAWGKNVGHGLVSALEIVLDSNVVSDLEEDDGSSEDKRDSEEDPVADELLLEGELPSVEVVHHGGPARLYTLIEADIVCRAATRVG